MPQLRGPETRAPTGAASSSAAVDPDPLGVADARLLDLLPGFVCVLKGPDHVFAFANRAYMRLVGERPLIGRRFRDVYPSLVAQGFVGRIDEVFRTGRRYTAHDIPITPSILGPAHGSERFIDFTCDRLLGPDGEAEGVVVEGHDVTDSRRTQARLQANQRRQALLIELTDRFRDLESPADISYAAAELLGRALGVSRAGYGTVDPAAETITIERDWNAPGISSLAGVLRFRDYGSYIEDLKRGDTVVFADARSDPRTRDTAEALEAISAQAVVNMPVSEQDGLVALLYLNHAAARPWTEDELALIREVAERTRSAVERRRAEEELSELTARLKLAQRAARAVTWHHDLRTGVVEWSDPEAIEELTGRPLPGRMPISQILELLTPDGREAYVAAWRARLPEGEGRVAFRLPVEGETRHFETFGRVTQRGSDGTAEVLVGIMLDVTDRQRAEEARRHSEARLRLAIDAAQMAVWQYEPAIDRMTSSPELNRLMGFPADVQPTFQQLRSCYVEGEEERVRDAALAALARGETFLQAEYRFRRLDGAVRWGLIRADITPDHSGRPGLIIGIVADITERKAVEEALREREAELKAALAAGGLATFDFDHVTQTMKASPGLNELYGFPPDHAVTIEDIRSRYYPDGSAALRAEREHDDPTRRYFEWVLRLLLPDGRLRWVEGRGEYVRDAAGRLLRSRGVVGDITERKRSEEHQRLLVNELNHRVKNTLAIVQGLARQSFRAGEDSARARDAFEARLEALSSAHNLLTAQSWESASMAQVVDSTAQAALGPDADRVRARGPHVLLPPKTAVSVALAVHELCTNALKYGALSVPEGEVQVSWTTEAAGEARLRFAWVERGGPPVAPPSRSGFGSRMIRGGLAGELGGTVSLDFDPAGVVCRIDAPLPAEPASYAA